MITFTVKDSADEVIRKLQAGIEAMHMRQVSHINGQANAKLIGKDVPADQILEIFRPDFAVRVWEACKQAGLDIPLRIHVYEDDAGTQVAFRTASETFEGYESLDLMGIAEELDAVFAGILSYVEEV